MKKFLVVAMAIVMAICSFAMVGCGKEGVSFEDFNTRAKALEANAPELKSGYVNFQFSGDDDLGPDIKFEIDEDGKVTYDEERVEWYSPMVWEEIPRFLNSTFTSSMYVWNVEEVEEKDEKTESGLEYKTSVVYQTQNELSIKINDYMKTAKGNVQDSTSYKKYDKSTGYIIERVKKSNISGEIKMVIVWDQD